MPPEIYPANPVWVLLSIFKAFKEKKGKSQKKVYRETQLCTVVPKQSSTVKVSFSVVACLIHNLFRCFTLYFNLAQKISLVYRQGLRGLL